MGSRDDTRGGAKWTEGLSSERVGSRDDTRGGAKWTEGRALVWTQCACSERSRGKYKKLEHSKGIYFPTLIFSQRTLGGSD